MRTASTLAVLIAMLSALPALGQEASREDFKSLCSDMVGRWVGDVTWIADWPGLGKKGDKVTGYWLGKVAEDGNLLTGKFFGGNGSETSMGYFDSAEKRIRWLAVDAGGTVMRGIFYRKGGKWMQEQEVTLPNGTKGSVKSVGTITEGGKTWTWEMNGKVGDDVIKNQKDVWRRVSK